MNFDREQSDEISEISLSPDDDQKHNKFENFRIIISIAYNFLYHGEISLRLSESLVIDCSFIAVGCSAWQNVFRKNTEELKKHNTKTHYRSSPFERKAQKSHFLPTMIYAKMIVRKYSVSIKCF